MTSIDPQNARLLLEDEDIKISHSATNIVVAEEYPQKIDTFGNVTDKCIDVITKYLELNVFYENWQ